VNRAVPAQAPAPIAPGIRRTPMAAKPWRGLSLLSWAFRVEPGPPDVDGPARSAGRRRRFVLLALSLAPAIYATYVMSGLLPDEASSLPEKALLAVFAILSCWLAAGFWTAMMGFVVLMRGGDRHLISRSAVDPGPLPRGARTAVVMPVCNEDVKRVFAGLRATIESVARAGAIDHFDFFVLSDSSEPDTCVAELDAWHALRDALSEQLNADVRLFYRRRERRVKRKSGNVDDFCRRWGALYRYMVVLDADSVMSGQCLSTLVRLMEARPDAGIIQTAPCAVGRDTLHARIQQFANQVYGPLFTAGLHYWQLGESHYWGHNAIIRLEPFMKHCVLAPLPGRGALAGEILSHDFVEAALMRRAGYGVWIAYDLPGSYEEMPSNLIEEVGRDRRWCHGNLMNARLMFAPGMHPVHRTVFLTGALAYLSAPLWAGFLALSTWLLVTHVNAAP
jgi:membrane glycosyltransferase